MPFFGANIPAICLDEEFDAPDVAADHELCQAIVAGKMGLHPDGWGNHDPLPLRWLTRRRRVPEEVYAPPVDRKWRDDARWEAEHGRRPVEKPVRRWPRWYPPLPQQPPPPWMRPPDPSDRFDGEIQLDCDDCGAKFWPTMNYDAGHRAAAVAQLQQLGRDKGWTHIVGCDRCPQCSTITAPEHVSNGTGEHQGDEQHA